MNLDEFWSIVERVHVAAPRDMDAKCRLLDRELRELPLEEVLSFEKHFSDCLFRAYDWGIWGAAFVINDGCSDDSFMDFRSTLISLGREAFENALVNPDSLADVEIDAEWAAYEGYQYVAPNVYLERSGALPRNDISLPRNITGVRFDEWAMSERFPRLVQKFDYRDSDWLFLKLQKEKAEQQAAAAERISNLLLNSRVVPACGLIPPFAVAASVLQQGRYAAGDHQYIWEPFQLTEQDYWAAVVRLEKMTAEELVEHPHLREKKLQHDSATPPSIDMNSWIQSLKGRGFV
ncbi:MAG: DUF4240 domain-containing protein [Limisphaerales bacterium]